MNDVFDWGVVSTDRIAAARWAAALLAREDWVILDTETTGFSHTAEIIQVSVIDHQGNALLDTLVKPLGEIGEEAAAVNGITLEMCATAPTWPEVYPELCKVIAGKTVVIYNRSFDLRMMKQNCGFHGLDGFGFPFTGEGVTYECAMLAYAQWFGEWNRKYKNYKNQKLPGGDHTALGDCRATLGIIKKMAASLESEMEIKNA